MSVAASDRHGASQVIFESYPEVGYNYRMTDIQAAVGREQLKRVPGMVERRREIAEAYRRDRRKDALLQENGYCVLRFLATDLGTYLDDVLDRILRTLENRRSHHHRR